MKRLIAKYTVLIMVISSILLMGAFYSFTFFRLKTTEIKYIITGVNQVISILEASQVRQESAETLFKDDYVTRAQSLAYIINQVFKNNPQNTDLKQLAQQMQVEKISIINENGIVIKSSEETMLGFSFQEDETLAEHLPFAKGETDEGYYIDTTGHDVTSDESMVYIGVRPENQSTGVIEIAVKPQVLAAYKDKSSIATILKEMPTRDYITIFVVSNTTGELLGITENNDLEINVDGTTTLQERAEALEKYIDNPGKIKINGENRLIYVRPMGDNLVCKTSNLDRLYSSVLIHVVLIGILVVILTIVIIYSFYKMINRFIIQDLMGIIQGVESFLGGNKKVVFRANPKTELYQMAEGLNKWVKFYLTKSERDTKIVSMMGNSMGTFEYSDDLKQVYYSDNLPKMFGLTGEQWEEKLINTFNKVNGEEKQQKIQSPRVEFIKTLNGRELEIQYVVSDNSCYGVVRDVSEERAQKQQLSDALYEANQKAQKDGLTGLYNRNKAKEIIDEWFAEDNKNGVMLLMDMDNFKKVNDENGHPEGDALLKKFAHLLNTQFRGSDLKARIGGDEFIVFMPNQFDVELLEAKLKSFLFACRSELRKYYLEQRVSVSVGVAYVDNKINSFDDLYECADAAMYVAKRRGKDAFYVNEENLTCMGTECTHCRLDCSRRRMLFDEE